MPNTQNQTDLFLSSIYLKGNNSSNVKTLPFRICRLLVCSPCVASITTHHLNQFPNGGRKPSGEGGGQESKAGFL